MSLTINLKKQGQIEYLVKRFSCFSKLKNKQIWEYDMESLLDYIYGKENDVAKTRVYRWNTQGTAYFDNKTEVPVLPVMFIGKTGYGKSSLLNYIIGQPIFPVDDIKPCTEKIDAALFRIKGIHTFYLALCDLPGIGESEQADKSYIDWYIRLMKCSPCIVYVMRADQRDFSIDEMAFKKLFTTEEDLEKVIVVMNYADKIGRANRSNEISEEQREELDDKREIISEMFNVASYRIFPCCAHDGYGVEDMLQEVIESVQLCLIDE